MPDPYEIMAANPYLQMQVEPPRPHWSQVLGNALVGVGAGISQADAGGRGWASGIGPGLMYGSQLTAQSQHQAEQERMKRFQLGLMAQQFQDKRDALKRDQALGNDISTMMGMNVQANPVRMGPGDPGSVIGGIESGGRYDAVGPETGKGRALGKYQVMSFNVAPWTKEVLGQEMTPEQFLASPQAQDAVFKTKFGQYAQKYGNDGAARAWFAGEGGMNNPNARDVLGTTVADYSRKFNAGMGGPMVAQGDAISGQGDAPSGVPGVSQNAIAGLPMEVRGSIALMAKRDPEKALQMLVTAIQNQKKEDVYTPLSPESAKMFGLDPAKAWQMNKVTRKIEPIGGSLVTINQDQEKAFAKAVGENDAKRLKDIQDAESQMSDFASKIRFATDQLGETYTGTGAEGANAFFKALGSFGFEEAAKKANAAAGAQAIIAQMKPHMRAAGSGASSDKDMDMFAQALPSLVNLPGGNQRIAAYFERLSDRASKIRELAETYSEGGTKALTGTKFSEEVKKLGPLFKPEEVKELTELGKGKPQAKTDRKPLADILGDAEKNRTPMPSARPPLGSILGTP